MKKAFLILFISVLRTKNRSPPPHCLFKIFSADCACPRIIFHPGEGFAGIDNSPRAREVGLLPLLRCNPRIQWAAPTRMSHFKGCCRITSGADRPQDVAYVRRVHIIVHQDDKPAVITPGPASQHRMRSLTTMARIFLSDGYDDEIVVAGFEQPNPLDLGNSRLLYRIPNRCGYKKRRVNQR